MNGVNTLPAITSTKEIQRFPHFFRRVKYIALSITLLLSSSCQDFLEKVIPCQEVSVGEIKKVCMQDGVHVIDAKEKDINGRSFELSTLGDTISIVHGEYITIKGLSPYTRSNKSLPILYIGGSLPNNMNCTDVISNTIEIQNYTGTMKVEKSGTMECPEITGTEITGTKLDTYKITFTK